MLIFLTLRSIFKRASNFNGLQAGKNIYYYLLFQSLIDASQMSKKTTEIQ
jgi:hypothetical protein